MENLKKTISNINSLWNDLNTEFIIENILVDINNNRLDIEAKIDSINDIVFSDDKVSKLKSQVLHIELDEHRIQLERIEQENERNQKVVRDSKLVVILFIIGIIILLLLLLVLYKNIKSKLNQIL